MKKLPVILLFCFVVSCSTASPDSSILNNSQCDIPCWNNISPGTTSYSEALEIVAELEGVNPVDIVDINQPWNIFDKRIWFHINNDSLLGKRQTDGAIYFIDDKVAAVILQRYVGLNFGELVTKTDEPESIISMSSPGGNILVMALAPTKGVKFEFYSKAGELEPETVIDNIMFFNPVHYEKLLDAGMFSMGEFNASDTKKIMYPWKGYGNIDELYPLRLP